MSTMTHETTIEEITELVRETSVGIAWRQWASLGAAASSASGRAPSSIVDPESLVLLSLIVRDAERRLGDFVAWWAVTGSALLSVQRMKTMLELFPDVASDAMSDYAHLALDSGDRRWHRYAGPTGPTWSDRSLKGAASPRLESASSLMVRMRAGFGVNAKADALTFLLGSTDAATVVEIAEATAYSKVAIRNALNDMLMARLVHEVPGQPSRYFLRFERWAGLLEMPSAKVQNRPLWSHWFGIHAFLANAYVLFDANVSASMTPYVLSSRARDLAEQFAHVLAKIRIAVPTAGAHKGAAYLEAFRDLVIRLHEATERSV
jgi:hypothetical protein